MRHMTNATPSAKEVREALEATGGRVQDAANLLRISRVHLWRLRRTYGIGISRVVEEKEQAA